MVSLILLKALRISYNIMQYRREIDGLRAIAVVSVILFHANFDIFSGGFVGVDVFFVISGYLITKIILTEIRLGKFSIVNFYERRARRILPALFLVMLVCVPFAWFWLLPIDMKDFSQSLIAVSFFASNILFWREGGYFDTAAELKPLLHTWSLAVEEQYYVLFPLFMILFWKLGKRWILVMLGLLFIASFIVAQYVSYVDPVAAFYLLPTRAWEFLIGTFAAFLQYKLNRNKFSKITKEIGGWIGIALILFAVLTFNKATPFPGLYAFVPTLGTILVILFATKQTNVNKFVGNKAFVGIGLISYSAYLWHYPLFAFARHISLTEPSHSIFLILSLLSLIFAYFSYRFIETPFRSKIRFDRSLIFTFAIMLSFIFILFGLYGHKSNGFQSRLNSNIISKVPDMLLFENQVRECWQIVEGNSATSSSCTLGANNGPIVFGLLGDSHAGSLLHVLDQETKKIGLKGKNYSYRSCPPLSTAKPYTQGRHELLCNDLRKNFFRAINTNPSSIPDVVIVSSRWTFLMEKEPFNNREGGVEHGNSWLWDFTATTTGGNYSDNMRSEITESIQMILNAGKVVILIYPIPEMGWDVPRLLLRNLLFNKNISSDFASVSYDRFLERNKSTIEMLDAIDGGNNLIRIIPQKVLCNSFIKDRCAAHLNEQSLYFDNNHLSNKGAEIVLQEVIFELSRIGY